jgi:hypothetical protein
MCNQDGDERCAIEHSEPHAPYGLPRWIAN